MNGKVFYVLESRKRFSKRNSYVVGKSNSKELIENMLKRQPKCRGRKLEIKTVKIGGVLCTM